MSSLEAWQRCVDVLEHELSAQQFNTWVRPLQAVADAGKIRLLAPNRFVLEWVRDRIVPRALEIASGANGSPVDILVEVGSAALRTEPALVAQSLTANDVTPPADTFESNLIGELTFARFVEGKSNQLARAAAMQVGRNPGREYNPLFIYGGVGLGKTHLMHAAGHAMLEKNPSARVLSVRSERFVQEMVQALQVGRMAQFKSAYRRLDALLIDDIQFFVGKDRSQEEFFHTFNELIECGGQIVITADRFPKELTGVEERLISRFESGLTVAIEPPELETRVAILMSKAAEYGLDLPEEVAFFVAKRVRANVRELEGALRRLSATASFTGVPLSVELAQHTLKDLLAYRDRQITIANIQKTVAEYFKIRIADLQSKDRSRTVTRPRQLAMALTKELTSHSLPEIGDAFGGRDHTTVLHACRKVSELLEMNTQVKEDHANLQRLLAR
jgi:chromosomal replication initiator protein